LYFGALEKHTVYILYSISTDRFYKGATKDVKERLSRHNAGYEKATKPGKPWTLIWTTQKPSKSEAIKLEYKLKNLSRKRLIDFILKYSDGVASQDELLLLKQLS